MADKKAAKEFTDPLAISAVIIKNCDKRRYKQKKWDEKMSNRLDDLEQKIPESPKFFFDSEEGKKLFKSYLKDFLKDRHGIVVHEDSSDDDE